MGSEGIRCPKRHCPDPSAGWSFVKTHEGYMSEYVCHACGKHFLYSTWLRKNYYPSPLKYFFYIDKFAREAAKTLVASLEGAKGLRSVSKAQYADIIIVLGGDGTMLRAAHKHATLGKPLLGFYFHPSKGFLSNADSEFSLNIIKHERYEIFQAPLLEVKMKTTSGKMRTGIALNELSIKGAASTQTVSLEVSVDGELLLDRLMADGLIVSTPLGSTGYAVPAGGSAILPSLHAFEIVPNNSSKPKHRTSQIVSDSSIVKVRVLDLPRRKVVVGCDNDVYENVCEIEIRRAGMPIQLAFIKPDDMTWDQFFLARSKEKIYD